MTPSQQPLLFNGLSPCPVYGGQAMLKVDDSFSSQIICDGACRGSTRILVSGADDNPDSAKRTWNGLAHKYGF